VFIWVSGTNSILLSGYILCYGIVTKQVRGSEYMCNQVGPENFFRQFSSTGYSCPIHSYFPAIHTIYSAYPPKSKVFRQSPGEMHKYLWRKNYPKSANFQIEKL